MATVLKSIFTAFLSVAMVSCATMISGTQQRIPVITDKPGAAVFVNHVFKDSTPCIIKIKRSWDEPPPILLSKPGYHDQNLILNKKLNELALLNFINVFGWALDGATAACLRYELPDTIVLTPRKKTP